LKSRGTPLTPRPSPKIGRGEKDVGGQEVGEKDAGGSAMTRDFTAGCSLSRVRERAGVRAQAGIRQYV
jgi:hypothetical protein